MQSSTYAQHEWQGANEDSVDDYDEVWYGANGFFLPRIPEATPRTAKLKGCALPRIPEETPEDGALVVYV